MSASPRRFLFVVIFLCLGILCEILFWFTNTNAVLVLILSPVLYLAHLVESQFSFLALTPLVDELVFVLPINLLYFGLTAYWLKRILEERGAAKITLLFVIVLFYLFIHWQAALSLRQIFPFLEGLLLPEYPLR